MSLPAQAADATPRYVAITGFAEGRFEEVVAALPGDALEPELAYLRARALAELERYAEALEALPTPPASWPEEVRADLTALQRRWAAEVGRCTLLEPEPKSDEARRLRAQCALVSGDYATARDLLREARDLDGRVLLVRALVSLGALDEARPLARVLYVEAPNHEDAVRIGDVLRDAAGHVDLSPDERLARAEAWIEARRPEDALHDLDQVPTRELDDKQHARLLHLRGEALFRTRKRYPEAAKAFAAAAKLGGTTEAYDAFHSVRALSRAGQDKAAIKGYREFAKSYPKSTFAPEATYLAAWLGAREHDPKAQKALAAFASSEAAKQAPGLRHDAHWELAWMALGAKNGRDAETWLERYAKGADSPLDAARAAYWRGRAAQLRRDKSAAAGHYTEALAADPLGYYALLAARKLTQLGRTPPLPWNPGTGATEQPSLIVPAAVEFYARLGLADDAARAAESWLETLKQRAARVAGLLATGHTARTFAAAEPLMRDVLTTAPDGPSQWLWRVLFPDPYRDTVAAECTRHDLDPDEVYGHMQVESRYKVRAVSGADALGLLQLLPQTASKVAQGLGIAGDRRATLSPRTNLVLGITYLGGLLRHYKGQLPPAIAAYNAGTARVDEWLREAKHHDLDRWVEEIPVEQTRNYVRRVISAWSRYHALSHPNEPYALVLPEHVSAVTE